MTSGSNTNQLKVLLGNQRVIATLTLPVGSETELMLTYEPDWVIDGFAISPHLPLSGNFDSRAVRHFLQNMLPEGKGLEELTSNTTISRNNTFGLIKVIGTDTSGALSFISDTQDKTKTDFRLITKEELNKRLERYRLTGESIAYWDGRVRLSVAGVQDKLNLLEIDGQTGFGEGDLCSTKIFKFESGRAPFIAVNEFFTLNLAQHAGLPVPATELRTYGGVRTLVVERFDRKLDASSQRVFRRHVIDGCQATNLPPSYKYERQHGDEGDGRYIRDGVSFPKLFAIHTANQAHYRAQLIRWMIFNVLVRNYDAHGKNISFYVGKNGLTLAPFYDLVNIKAIIDEIEKRQQDAPMDQHYAMSMGEYESGTAGNFSEPITAYMLADMAEEFGFSPARMQLLAQQTIDAVHKGISSARAATVDKDISSAELAHVDQCIAIIQQASAQLTEQIALIPAMAKRL